MIEFIDKTTEQNGTPINRKNMMAIQGFVAKTTTFSDNGDIVETNADGHIRTTTFNSDGSIVETFVGEKTISKTTTFDNESIVEVVS